MQHFVISRKGKPTEVLQLLQSDHLLKPNAGQVVVTVKAVGLGFQDAAACLNPSTLGGSATPGQAFSGIITGSLDAKWPVGTEVLGWCKAGALASELLASTSQLVVKPGPMSFEQAACLPLSYVAAWQLLTQKVVLKPTHRILIHGGAGGLGTALISLARYLGLEIYATAEAKFHTKLHLLGASPINYQAEDFERAVKRLSIDGAHAVFDCLGGTLLKSFDCLRPGGVLVSTGCIQDEKHGSKGPGIFTTAFLALKTIGAQGREYRSYSPWAERWQQRWHKDLVDVVQVMMSGKVELPPYKAVQAKDLPLALQDLLTYKGPLGKYVLTW